MSKMIKVDSCNTCINNTDWESDGIPACGHEKCCFALGKYNNTGIHPDCPLPDYVDVSRLQKERDELVKALEFIASANDVGAYVSPSALKSTAREALAKIKGGKDEMV